MKMRRRISQKKYKARLKRKRGPTRTKGAAPAGAPAKSKKKGAAKE